MNNKFQIKNILRVRLTLDLTQRQFANKLGVSQSTVNLLENGIREKIPESLNNKLLLMTKNLELIDNDEIKKKKEQFQKRGQFFGKRAKMMGIIGGKKGSIISMERREPTEQEQRIIEMLKKNKISYELNAHLITKTRDFVVDFAIPNKIEPKIIIEVKELKSEYRKYLQCVELAWRIIKLKNKYPNSRFYVCIEGKLIDSEIKIINEEANKLFINKEISNLFNYLKEE